MKGRYRKKLWIPFFLWMVIPCLSQAELGVAINDTRTPLGSEFYRLFSLYYDNGDSEYNILITEESGQWGSVIRVFINENEIYVTPRLNYAEIEERAKEAVDAVRRFIAARKNFSK